jgi:hypothetical protein
VLPEREAFLDRCSERSCELVQVVAQTMVMLDQLKSDGKLGADYRGGPARETISVAELHGAPPAWAPQQQAQ